MFPRFIATLCALTALVVCAKPARAAIDAPQRGKRLFVDCAASHERNAWKNNPWWWVRYWRRHDAPTRAAWVARIAKVPQAKWFTGSSIRTKRGRRKAFERFFAGVDDPQWGGPTCSSHVPSGTRSAFSGSYPVIAIRAMKHDRCKGYDGGGKWNRVRHGAYKPWIDDFVAALQKRWNGPRRYVFWAHTVWPRSYFAPTTRPATVIIEPDAVGLMSRRSGCLTKRARRNRFALLRYAAERLGALESHGITTYLDVGSSGWVTRHEAVSMLRKAGVRYVRGFATNSTHFNSTKKEMAFADAVARRLGKRYVVNTAENGRGSLPKKYWTHGHKSAVCNPKNAGLGHLPTTDTGSQYADAFLWISRPGISSNGKNGKAECGRGPLDNVWWNRHAFELARKAVADDPPWPSLPL